MSADYHPYVIADGKLVGEWDEMYEACDDPWGQSTDARSWGRRKVVEYARRIDARSLLEVGSGLGFFTAELDWEGFDVTGVECSPIALERARSLHPDLAARFELARVERDLGRFAGVDAIVFAEITWYVLDHIDEILDDLMSNHGGAHLIHLLSFYAPGRQHYGREFFTTPDELIARFGLPVVAAEVEPPNELGDYASVILFEVPE